MKQKMPASPHDPIGSVLKNSFHQQGIKSATMESKMESQLQKSFLTPVQYDEPVRLKPSGGIKPSYILLNPQQKGESEKPAENAVDSSTANARLDQVPEPKVVLFRREQIEVGYRKSGGPGAGMFNMGNTCYLNSALQALFHTPSLVNYLRFGGHERECNLSGFSSCTICLLSATLRQATMNNIIKPTRVYDELNFIAKNLVHGRQEDSHEFLRLLIESLQKCYLMSRKVPKNLDSYSKETTPFNQIFGGYMRQELHCLRCRHISTTFQHFMDILLDIRNADNLDAALAGYFKKEILGQDKEDMYKCEHCKQKVPAWKMYKIERPPIVLCIQLKRFNIMGGKNGRHVTLARNLDITRYVRWANQSRGEPISLKYRLVSLISHVGPSPNCGHYTAIGEAPNEMYYRFDDASVNPVNLNHVLNTNTSAYVMFYEITRQSREHLFPRKSTVTANSSSAPTSSKLIGSNASSKLIGPQLPPTTSSSKLIGPLLPPASSSSSSGTSVNSQKVAAAAVERKVNGASNGKGASASDAGKKTAGVSSTCLVPYDSDDSDDDVNNAPNSGSSNSNNSKMSTSGPSSKPTSSGAAHTSQPSSSKNGANDSAGGSSTSSWAAAAALASSSANSNGGQSSAASPAFMPRSVQRSLLATKTQNGSGPSGKLQSKDVGNGEANNSTQSESASKNRVTFVRQGSISPGSDGDSNASLPTCADRVGVTVNDKDSYNPSIHSDNSAGSTHSFTVSDIQSGSSPANHNSNGATGVTQSGWVVESLAPTRSSASTSIATSHPKATTNTTATLGKNTRPSHQENGAIGREKSGKFRPGDEEGGAAGSDSEILLCSPKKRPKLTLSPERRSASPSTSGVSGNDGGKAENSTGLTGWTVKPAVKSALGSVASGGVSVLGDMKKIAAGSSSVLGDVRKTTESFKEKMSKLKQQFGFRSNRVDCDSSKKSGGDTDSLRSDNSTASKYDSHSMNSMKANNNDDAESDSGNSEDSTVTVDRKRKKHKKNKKKSRSRKNSSTDTNDEEENEWVEKTKESMGRGREDRERTSDGLAEASSHNEDVRRTTSNANAPIKKWDSRPDLKQIGRSVTWDGTKGTNFLDEIKRSSAITSWGANHQSEHQEQRKRSAASDNEAGSGYDDDYDGELDRGRVKKVKKHRQEDQYGYRQWSGNNPFQKAQESKYRGGDQNTSFYSNNKNHRDSFSNGGSWRGRNGRGGGGHHERSYSGGYNRSNQQGSSGDRYYSKHQHRDRYRDHNYHKVRPASEDRSSHNRSWSGNSGRRWNH